MKKISNYCFWLGAVLFVISYYISNCTNNLELSLRADLFTILPIHIVCLFAIVIAPITEEFIFRSLLVVPQKNMRRQILSSACFLFFFVGFQYWNIIPIALGTVLIYWFLGKERNEKIKTYTLLILTSFCFSLAHITMINWFNTPIIVMYTGLGLCFGTIAINYGLKKAMLGHAIYNICVLIPIIGIGIKSYTTPPKTWNNNTFSGSISLVAHQFQMGATSYRFLDSIVMQNQSLNDIAFNLESCTNCLKVRKGNPFNKAIFKAFSKDYLPLNYAVLLDSLIHTNLVVVDRDTTYNQEHYILQTTENCSLTFGHISPDFHSKIIHNSDELAEYIYKKYNIVAVSGKNKIRRSYKFSSKDLDHSFDDFRTYLKENYCTELIKSNASYTRVTIN